MKVTGLLKSSQKIRGVCAKDMLSGEEYELKGRAIINATGVFTDQILRMDGGGADSKNIIKPSQGIHIMLDDHFLPADTAMMMPKTSDGRLLFALPWHDKVMVGTTDTPIDNITDEPKAKEEEIEFVLNNIAKYLTERPTRSDVKSILAGLRPLVQKGNEKNTAAISRDHSLMVSSSGLITIAGGKWTTYRKMAEDTVDRVCEVTELPEKECVTEKLHIHGWSDGINNQDPLGCYGSEKANIKRIIKDNPKLKEPLHSRLPYIKAEVIWATRSEMAMTVEDFNARRTRALLLDAKASVEMAPEVAKLMAAEAGYDDQWIETQINRYTKLAKSYQVSK